MLRNTIRQQGWPLIIGLYCFEGAARGLLLAIVPLRLLAQFGTLHNVTFFYVGSAVFALANSILVPWLIERFGVRRVLILSGGLIVVTAILIASDTLLGVGIGLVGRTLALACMDIPLLAVIMSRIPRQSLGTFEPVRVFAQGLFITVAPWAGFKMYEHFVWLPFAASLFCGLLFMLASGAVPASVTVKRPMRVRKLASAARFFRQRRLVAAWVLAVIRSSFWQAFFIYASIFAVSCGWSTSASAAVVSFGLATLVFVPMWGKMGRTFGARPVLLIAYAMGGLCLVGTAISGLKAPFVAPLFLLAATFFASMIDGIGNVLFLRAVRTFERPAMAGVYMTYRDIAQFLTIALFALILTFVSFPIALLTIAAAFFAASYLSSLVHPRIR
jgi:MFS family permease